MIALSTLLILLAISGMDGHQCREFKWDKTDGLEGLQTTTVREGCVCKRTYYMNPTCREGNEEGYLIEASHSCKGGKAGHTKLSVNQTVWKLKVYCGSKCKTITIDPEKMKRSGKLSMTKEEAVNQIKCHLSNMKLLLKKTGMRSLPLPSFTGSRTDKTTKDGSDQGVRATTTRGNMESKPRTSKGSGGRNRGGIRGRQKGTTTSARGNGDEGDQGPVAMSIPDKEAESSTGSKVETDGEPVIGNGKGGRDRTSSSAPPRRTEDNPDDNSEKDPFINLKSSSEKPTTNEGVILPGSSDGRGTSSPEERSGDRGNGEEATTGPNEINDPSETGVEMPPINTQSEKPSGVEDATTAATSTTDPLVPQIPRNDDLDLDSSSPKSVSNKTTSSQSSDLGVADETSATTPHAKTTTSKEQEDDIVPPIKTTKGSEPTTPTTSAETTTVSTTKISTTSITTTTKPSTTTTTVTTKPTTTTLTGQDSDDESTTSAPFSGEESTESSTTSLEPEGDDEDATEEPGKHGGEDSETVTTQDDTNRANTVAGDGEDEDGDEDTKTTTKSVPGKVVHPKVPTTQKDGQKAQTTVPQRGTTNTSAEIVEAKAIAAKLKQDEERDEIRRHNKKAAELAMSLLSGLLVLMTLLSGGMIALIYLLMVVMNCKPKRFGS